MLRSLSLAFAAPALALGSAAVAQSAPTAAPPKPITRADFVKKIDGNFAALDGNHDGAVTRAELEAAQQHAFLQRLQAEFKQLDTNHDGQLSFQEFAAAAHPNVTADQILQKLDTNHDGKVSAEEFRAPQLETFAKLDANHDGVVTPDEMRKAMSPKK